VLDFDDIAHDDGLLLVDELAGRPVCVEHGCEFVCL
jgi:hypothetical protein